MGSGGPVVRRRPTSPPGREGGIGSVARAAAEVTARCSVPENAVPPPLPLPLPPPLPPPQQLPLLPENASEVG